MLNYYPFHSFLCYWCETFLCYSSCHREKISYLSVLKLVFIFQILKAISTFFLWLITHNSFFSNFYFYVLNIFVTLPLEKIVCIGNKIFSHFFSLFPFSSKSAVTSYSSRERHHLVLLMALSIGRLYQWLK